MNLLRPQKALTLLAILTMPHALHAVVLNNPYSPIDTTQKIYYSSFTEQPKTLDPAISYAANEYQFIGQIYEPVLQYDYFTRPYTLTPLTATSLPDVHYYDKAGHLLNSPLNHDVYKSVYMIHIKPGIMYQPHPALAKDPKGNHKYLHLSKHYIEQHNINQLTDFKHTGTRELTAMDYIYQIKRLANPRVNSSIYGMMGEHIEGFLQYAKVLPSKKEHPGFVDLRNYPLSGVRLIDRYTYQITLKGQYPQFMFWLAMSFFAPVPWEADQFYAQPGMKENNISFGWYPVGTGAFMLTENNPNSRMTLEKNPNYRETYFPSSSNIDDQTKGYLTHVGERLPMLDKVELVLEKETIPRWNKFLQGYYDVSGIAADSFDQAIAISSVGNMTLTPQMKDKGLKLQDVTEPAVYFMGFNMLDPIVGGSSDSARQLRQAISIAVNYEENISIFLNGQGSSAQGPIPQGIFGFQEGQKGMNPYTYRWENNQQKRRSLSEARALMKAAGYPNGRDLITHRPLILHYDVPSSGSPDEKAQLNWMMKQFATIGIHLDVRTTQYNRFQEKMRNGNAQIFLWGWSADYPDPENFLFLLYGPNGKVKYAGENVNNYENPQFDALFEQMKNRPNDKIRQHLIDDMLAIVQRDAVWAGGVNTRTPVLRQQWMSPIKPNSISQNALKYVSIDVSLRHQLRDQWNQVSLWPIAILIGLFGLLLLPFVMVYQTREGLPVKRMKSPS